MDLVMFSFTLFTKQTSTLAPPMVVWQGGKLLGNLLTQVLFALQHITSGSVAWLSLMLGPSTLWSVKPLSASLILPRVHIYTSGICGVKTFFLCSAATELAWVGLQGCETRIWLKACFLLFHCGIQTFHPIARAKQNQFVKSILNKSCLPNQRCLYCASSEGSWGSLAI